MKVDKLRIKEIFEKGKDYIILLDEIIAQEKNSIEADFKTKAMAERVFEVLSQIILDVCTHIISYSEISPPQTYSDCITKLGNLKILDTKSVKKFRALIGMRNVIVHQYDNINSETLYEGLINIKSDFEDFSNQIRLWIEKET